MGGGGWIFFMGGRMIGGGKFYVGEGGWTLFMGEWGEVGVYFW